MELSQDFKEWLVCLNATKTEYVVVGGYALAHHGCPRNTGDLDVLVRPSSENACRVLDALRAFGFGSLNITQEDLNREGRVIQLGFPPQRIDILTSIDGVDWETASASPSIATIDGITTPFISVASFLLNKRATGRLRDIADAEDLERKLDGA